MSWEEYHSYIDHLLNQSSINFGGDSYILKMNCWTLDMAKVNNSITNTSIAIKYTPIAWN